MQLLIDSRVNNSQHFRYSVQCHLMCVQYLIDCRHPASFSLPFYFWIVLFPGFSGTHLSNSPANLNLASQVCVQVAGAPGSHINVAPDSVWKLLETSSAPVMAKAAFKRIEGSLPALRVHIYFSFLGHINRERAAPALCRGSPQTSPPFSFHPTGTPVIQTSACLTHLKCGWNLLSTCKISPTFWASHLSF